MKPDIGLYYEMVDSIAASTEQSLSYLFRKWPEAEVWRTRARAKVFELLSFNPPKIPLNAAVDARREEEGILVEEISYDMPYGPRARGFFMHPRKCNRRLPAVVALHDHGGFKYYGKEKITAIPDEPEILVEFKKESYSRRSWATELAKRGFAVLAVDLFSLAAVRSP